MDISNPYTQKYTNGITWLLPGCYLAFEYAIPRMGKRIDTILLYQGVIFALEFKVGEKNYTNSAMEQSLDYAVDLKNFHE